MKRFIALYTAIDETTRTNEKVQALVDYFGAASPADAAWALFFLSGRKLRQPMAARKLAAWAGELAGIPPWLFSESYDAVGDLAETIELVKRRTRQFAKRQLTWFRSLSECRWIDAGHPFDPASLAERIATIGNTLESRDAD